MTGVLTCALPIFSFFGPHEALELTHRASSRQIFVNGALHVARRLVKLPKGRYQLEDILFGGNV